MEAMLERTQQSVDILFGFSDIRPTSKDAAIIVVAVHSLMIWLNVYLYRSLQRLRVRTIHVNEASTPLTTTNRYIYILTYPGVRPISVFTIVSSTDTNKKYL